MTAANASLMHDVLDRTDHPLLRRSLAPVAADPAGFARRFYEHLFRTIPGIRVLFPGDMAQQEMKLVQTLAMVVAGIDESERLVPMIRRLGAAHRGYGTKAMHYRFVGESLLATLRDMSGDHWDADTERAWQRLFQWVATHMIAGAEAAEAGARG